MKLAVSIPHQQREEERYHGPDSLTIVKNTLCLLLQDL